VRITCFGLLLVSAIGVAETPAFEVASIRPALDAKRLANEPFFCPFGCFSFEGRVKIAGSRLDIAYIAMDHLIVRAYRIKPHQLSGPDWMRQQRFDIIANLPEGASADQVPEMLQALLTERFKLATHRENRDQVVYKVVVDKNGPSLKQSGASSVTDAPGDTTLNSSQGPLQARQIDKGLMVTKGPWGPMRFFRAGSGQNGPEVELLSVTMPMFADVLTQFMDRPVVDMTSLKGSYQIGLATQDMEPFVRAKMAAAGVVRTPPPVEAVSDPTGGSTIFKTMEKLGLKLERAKLPVETLVVDHLEKTPTDN